MAALFVLICVLISVFYAQVMLRYTGGKWILPLDDTYIYLQYARNLADGLFLRFNPADPPSTGTTSIIYPFILSFGALLGFDGDGFVIFAFCLNVFFLSAASVLLLNILSSIYKQKTAVLSVLMVVTTGAITWGFLCGMEIGMVITLFLLFVKVWLSEHASRKLKWSPVLLALVALSRPEAIVFVIILLTLTLVLNGAIKFRLVLFPLLAIGSLLLLNYTLTGHFGPNSSRPKSVLFTPYFSLLFFLQHTVNFAIHTIKSLFLGMSTPSVLQPLNAIDQTAFVVPGALMFFLVSALPNAIGELRRRIIGPHLLLTVWFLSGFGCVAFLAGSGIHHFRYLLPFLFPLVAYIVPGMLKFAKALSPNNQRAYRSLAWSLIGFGLLFHSFTTLNFILTYGQTAFSFLEYRNVAEYARRKLPSNATLATLDVGILGYYSERQIFDLFGLVTNEMTESTFYFADVMGSKFEYMEKMPDAKRPEYFVLHQVRRDEHGDAAHLNPFRTNPIFVSFRRHTRFPAVGDSLSIYRFDWRNRQPSDFTYLVDSGPLHLIDRLDIADLDDHRTHDYHYDPAVPGQFSSNRAVVADYPDGRKVIDGALGVDGTQSFSFNSPARKPVLLVLRTMYVRQPVRVTVNNEFHSSFQGATNGKNWSELTVQIPADAVQPGTNRISVEGVYMSAYYWFFQ